MIKLCLSSLSDWNSPCTFGLQLRPSRYAGCRAVLSTNILTSSSVLRTHRKTALLPRATRHRLGWQDLPSQTYSVTPLLHLNSLTVLRSVNTVYSPTLSQRRKFPTSPQYHSKSTGWEVKPEKIWKWAEFKVLVTNWGRFQEKNLFCNTLESRICICQDLSGGLSPPKAEEAGTSSGAHSRSEKHCFNRQCLVSWSGATCCCVLKPAAKPALRGACHSFLFLSA